MNFFSNCFSAVKDFSMFIGKKVVRYGGFFIRETGKFLWNNSNYLIPLGLIAYGAYSG
jgi:hypothetical protein